jgi:hypothetical protein
MRARAFQFCALFFLSFFYSMFFFFSFFSEENENFFSAGYQFEWRPQKDQVT